jgi:hypothetical protein
MNPDRRATLGAARDEGVRRLRPLAPRRPGSSPPMTVGVGRPCIERSRLDAPTRRTNAAAGVKRALHVSLCGHHVRVVDPSIVAAHNDERDASKRSDFRRAVLSLYSRLEPGTRGVA